MDYAEENIINVYNNIAFIAMLEGYNMASMIKEADKEIEIYKEQCEGIFVPRGYFGLYYVELLAHKMNRTLGDIYNLSQNIKREALRMIIESYTNKCDAYNNNFENDDEGIKFSGFIEVNSINDLGEYCKLNCIGKCYYEPVDEYWVNMHNHKRNKIFYLFTFEKKFDEDLKCYIYSFWVSGINDFRSDYIYDEFLIWREKDGMLANFIEDCISDYYESNEEENEDDEDLEDEIESSHENKEPKIKPKVVEDRYDEADMDELVVDILSNTKTVDILDEFEGNEETSAYKRIVVNNGKYISYRHHNQYEYVYFNYIIERGYGDDYVRDITFTNFKMKKTSDLEEYVKNELSREDIFLYLDKDKFFRFTKPYLLRAQNSNNRTGYGSEWRWDYGDLIQETQGTLYGETTKYFIVGGYITTYSKYNLLKRKPFKKGEEKSKIIVFYDEKLYDVTHNKTILKYLKIRTNNGIKYIAANYDYISNKYYIHSKCGIKNKEYIQNGLFEIKDLKDE
ncbi:hypothetical protein SAMN02910289_00505 [Lachnospiraceae bacterium RM5]|nr:hypothetical protein SAMN02910289_00505 [Lachnospiraceae bacterium RM5]